MLVLLSAGSNLNAPNPLTDSIKSGEVLSLLTNIR